MRDREYGKMEMNLFADILAEPTGLGLEGRVRVARQNRETS